MNIWIFVGQIRISILFYFIFHTHFLENGTRTIQDVAAGNNVEEGRFCALF